MKQLLAAEQVHPLRGLWLLWLLLHLPAAVSQHTPLAAAAAVVAVSSAAAVGVAVAARTAALLLPVSAA